MRIVYRPSAVKDILDTSDYIKNNLNNPQAAQKLKEQIARGISLLKDNPNLGALLADKFSLSEDVNYRYIIIKKQIVFYEVNDDVIEIVRVLDGRTDYLSKLF